MKLYFYFRTHKWLRDFKISEETEEWYEYRIVISNCVEKEAKIPFNIKDQVETLENIGVLIIDSYLWLGG